MVTSKEFLCKKLAGFQLCALFIGSKSLDSGFFKSIYDAHSQWYFRSDYSQINFLFYGYLHNTRNIFCRNRQTNGNFFNTGISRCTV